MFTYSIHITPFDYPVTLNDSGAKVVWEEDENGVIFRKRLDGNFTFNRTGNTTIYDKIMDLTYCEQGVLTCTDIEGNIVQGSFMKKDLTISEDKCFIGIKFDKFDEYECIDTIKDKQINILATFSGQPELMAYTATVQYNKTYEYIPCYGVANRVSTFDAISGWSGLAPAHDMPYDVFGDCIAESLLWRFYQNEYTLSGGYTPGGINTFNVTTLWVRETRLVARTGGTESSTPVVSIYECDDYAWQYIGEVTLHGIVFDKFARQVDLDDFNDVGSPYALNSVFTIRATLTACNYISKDYDHCRKLNEVIAMIIFDCFETGVFESDFFKNTTNPISGKDLTNILIAQKSDCIGITSDPARIGNIKFSSLMKYLNAMFNVYWAIDNNGDLRIEHKYYWDNNQSYSNYPTGSNTVDIDLPAIYPMCLYGTNEYTFENNIPIRETFKFMEAWSFDFIGRDIDYSACIKKGNNIDHSAAEFTTEVDPVALDTFASKEGFCLFHCDPDGIVYQEEGMLSGTINSNMHLSWANLHYYYWKYDRYLPSGIMNGVETAFTVRPLKYQKQIVFPYCFGEFDPQRLIRTGLGDGIVKSAEFSFKTNWITVELKYKDIL